MNFIGNIFSLKSIIVFALVALFMAPMTNRPAEARGKARVKCPCTYTSTYIAGKLQAKALGGRLVLDACEDNGTGSRGLRLFGPEIEGCDAAWEISENFDKCNGNPSCCFYFAACEDSSMFFYNAEIYGLSSDEAEACEREIRSTAKLKRIPCVECGQLDQDCCEGDFCNGNAGLTCEAGTCVEE